MDADNQQQQPEDLQNMPPKGSMHQQLVPQQQCKEVVKRKTTRHEYVEVDGFHFRRKRRAPPTPLVSAAAANAAATAAAAGKGAGASAPSHQSPAAVKPSLQLDDAVQPSPASTPAAEQLLTADAGRADQGPAVDDDAAAVEQQAAAEDDCTAGAADEAAGHTQAAAGADPSAASQQAAAVAAEAAAAAQAAAATAAEAAAAAAAAEAAAADLEMVEASEEPASEEPAQQSRLPTPFTMLPAELCHLVSSFLAAEMHKLPGFTPTSAQQAADSIRHQLAQQLQQRKDGGMAAGQGAGADGQDVLQEQGEAAGAGQAVPPLTVLPHQLEELKEKLVDKHKKLLQEQEAWVQLLAQYNSMSSAPAADAAQGSDAAAGASPQQGLSGSGTQAASASAEAGVTTDMEVAEAAVQLRAAADPAAAEVTGEGSAGAEVGGADGPVCAEQQDSLLGVQLKVEVLTALVAKMEHLVGRAEATARALQAGYRAEKFSVFPHVDSPAMLIKSLAGRGSQATQSGTQRATQGGTQRGSQGGKS